MTKIKFVSPLRPGALLLLLSALCMLNACSKKLNNDLEQDRLAASGKTAANLQPLAEPDVYVVGYQIGTNGISEAKYWKNGTGVTLATNYAEARDIAISGNDVYIAGTEHEVAKYWKNGVAVSLSNTGTWGAYGLAIAVSGADVYVAGVDNGSDGVARPVYWKNGTQYALPTGSYNGACSVRDIAVSGNDVYIVGIVNGIASFWKNGVLYNLTQGPWGTAANAILLSGTDVYIAGQSSNTIAVAATYWKNGVATMLPTGIPAYPNATSEVSGIALLNGNVLTSGYVNTFAPKYWVNTTPNTLSSLSNEARARGMAVYNNDVYIAGYEWTPQGLILAKYWKNNIQMNLTDGTRAAEAYAIAIKPN
ncbi:hypothetical protein [Chitinophaga qingshengii]|uniref:Uncharacterized protein n=1 Tax=Chitinophaga qingshengii TaxID=1569794 RepID=A0ABR7TJA1_9BACT|nr:hypothetical protein [Chitinophaga qingshengii]MBC9930572.1 hypothetical protein [Chitinophaga qingshengii]